MVSSRRPDPRHVAAALLVVVLAVAFAVRLHGETVSPAPAANWDEMDWAWQGQSLLQTGVPVGWSKLPSYAPIGHVQLGTMTFPLVRPWMDHPPLFGVLTGGAVLLAGETTRASVDDAVVRLVPILLSLVTIVLAFLLAGRLAGRWTALAVAAVLAAWPAFVQASRLAESEALLAPLLLASLLLALRLRDGGRWRTAVALGGVCAAAVLTKEVGVSVGVGAAAVLLLSSRRRLAWVPLTGTLAGVAAYLAYAAAISFTQFHATAAALGDKRGPFWTAAQGFFTSTDAGLGIRVPLADPLWWLGWVALLVLAWRSAAWRPVAAVALVYAASVVALGSGPWMHWIGWYRIPDEPLVDCAAVCAVAAVAARLRVRICGACLY